MAVFRLYFSRNLFVGHVKFAEGTNLEPDRVRVEADGNKYHLPEAHVGMLRNHHTYHSGTSGCCKVTRGNVNNGVM